MGSGKKAPAGGQGATVAPAEAAGTKLVRVVQLARGGWQVKVD